MAPPVSVGRLWLQYPLLFVAHPVVSRVVHGSGISCHLLVVAPVSVVVHGSSIWCRPTGGSSISCRSWLQYLLSFVAPVSPVVRGSSICCLWLHSILLACGSSICRSWLQSPVAVVHGSSICRSWHDQYHLPSHPVAPVAPAVAQVLSIVTSCGSKLLLVAPVAAMVVFHPVSLTGSHLVFWRFFCKIAIYCCISPSIDS